METKMKKERDIKKNSNIKPIYSKNSDLKDNSLKEALSNSMTTTKNHYSIIWRPNNYRRQIKVKTKDNSALEKIKTTITHYSYCNHTKILSIKGYKPNITIQYAKDTLTAIYSQNKIGGIKEHYLIESNEFKQLQKAIDTKKQQIIEKMDKALTEFSKQFKVFLPLEKPIWKRHEDFIKGEEYIDKIPREVIIHDTHFKKVYGKGIEFIHGEPTVEMKNFIKNRAIEDIAPEIAKEIKELKKLNPLRYINTVEDVLSNQDIVRAMTKLEKQELERRLFG